MAVTLQTFHEEDLHLSELDDLLDEIEEDQKEHERKTSEVQLPNEDQKDADASSQSAQPPNAMFASATSTAAKKDVGQKQKTKETHAHAAQPPQQPPQQHPSSSADRDPAVKAPNTQITSQWQAQDANQKNVEISVDEDTKLPPAAAAEAAYDTPSTSTSCKAELSFAQWIRSLWKVGSKLEIYPVPPQYPENGLFDKEMWLVATVVRIVLGDDGEWIEVDCAQQLVRVRRDDATNVRPLSRALAVYKYIFNAIVAGKAALMDDSLSELQILSKKYPKSEQQFVAPTQAVSVQWPARGIRVVEELLRYYECGTFQDIVFTDGKDMQWTQLPSLYPTVTAMYVCRAQKNSASLSGIEYVRSVGIDDEFMSQVLKFLSAMKRRFLGVQVVCPANDFNELQDIANRFEHSFQLIRYKILIQTRLDQTETETAVVDKKTRVAFYIVHHSVHLHHSNFE